MSNLVIFFIGVLAGDLVALFVLACLKAAEDKNEKDKEDKA